MNDTIKGAMVGALIAGGLSFLITVYHDRQEANRQRAQQVIESAEHQTKAERDNELDFTMSLETMNHDLEENNDPAFESDAEKFTLRMDRREFDPFLEKRYDKDDSFRNEIDMLYLQIISYRKSQDSATQTNETNSQQVAKTKVVYHSCRVFSGGLLSGLRIVSGQLRSEMRRANLENEHATNQH